MSRDKFGKIMDSVKEMYMRDNKVTMVDPDEKKLNKKLAVH